MSDLPITSTWTIRASELEFTAVRSSGPGGQNVNKVNSKVTLKWKPVAGPGFDDAWRRRLLTRHANQVNRDGFLVIHSDATRDQSRNRDDACRRLRGWLLDCRFPPKKRTPTRPTLGSKRRRLDAKKRRSQTKQQRRNINHDRD
ncbi:MAG: alternative ribosome rescue aminoacyl-tRNA hydrolase ArfB [Planctomycetota bacterium]